MTSYLRFYLFSCPFSQLFLQFRYRRIIIKLFVDCVPHCVLICDFLHLFVRWHIGFIRSIFWDQIWIFHLKSVWLSVKSHLFTKGIFRLKGDIMMIFFGFVNLYLITFICFKNCLFYTPCFTCPPFTLLLLHIPSHPPPVSM